MNMKIKVKHQELPPFLPHGWKNEVAEVLGVHRTTVSRALREGRGYWYDRIVRVVTAKYGVGSNEQVQ